MDGIFTEIERQEILDIVPHEPEERLSLLKIIKEAAGLCTSGLRS